MRRIGLHYIIFIMIAAMLVGAACSSDTAGTASVSINTGLGTADKSAAKASAPSNITAINLMISGTGMDTIYRMFSLTGVITTGGAVAGIDTGSGAGSDAESSVEYSPATGVISLAMTPGSARTIALTAYTSAASPSVILSYAGSSVYDIAEGENNISVAMKISQTKIVIPDHNNYRVVQIDNMSDTTTVVMNSASFAPALSLFYPYDIDIDSIGRIYIANNYSSAGPGRVLRVNSIASSGVGHEVVVTESDVGGNVRELAIDRENNYLYFALLSNTIYRKKIDSADAPEDLSITDEVGSNRNITGLAVDDQGYLYVSNSYGGGVFKLDLSLPVGSRSIASYSVSSPYDILIKNQNIYIASTGLDQIIRLDPDMASPQTLANDPNNASDVFSGPVRFVGIMNRRIFVIDEDGGDTVDRVVAFDNISGSGWQTYDDGVFKFYLC